jgi:hypothetical protein
MFGQDDTQATNPSPTSGTLNDVAMSDPAATPFVASPSEPPVNDTAVFSPAPAVTPDTPPVDNPSIVSINPPRNEDLLDMKQQALQQLSPLINQLDQTPEEKFRTTMMMIQATDDQALLTSAYETAKQITDEKVRAQALLDVVNEINYFTQQHHSK